MPAWTANTCWTDAAYAAYRDYVRMNAPKLKGRTEDCSKLSILLLVDFAADNGLPVTLLSDWGKYYCSMEDKQLPGQIIGDVLTWKNKDEFYAALKRRINAKSLFNLNTIVNPIGPQAGDLMLTTGHAALVFAVYPPAVRHPKADDQSIPDFPSDPDEAARQLDQLEYFKSREPDGTPHFDYLNHRGRGKEKAELLYYSKVDVMKGYGFQFRMFKDLVLDSTPVSEKMKSTWGEQPDYSKRPSGLGRW